MEKRDIGIMAVVAIGTGMIILFLLAGITVAVGHNVPTEYWAAAASLSGAMVGLLAPQPATKGALTRQAARLNLAVAPESGAGPAGDLDGLGSTLEPLVPAGVGAPAAEGAAPGVRPQAAAQPAPPSPETLDLTRPAPPAGVQLTTYAATTARIKAVNDAASTASSYDVRIIGLILVVVAAFAVGISLALNVGDHLPATAYDTSVQNAATALIAVGSAAGGALVGLLAPTPNKTQG